MRKPTIVAKGEFDNIFGHREYREDTVYFANLHDCKKAFQMLHKGPWVTIQLDDSVTTQIFYYEDGHDFKADKVTIRSWENKHPSDVNIEYTTFRTAKARAYKKFGGDDLND